MATSKDKNAEAAAAAGVAVPVTSYDDYKDAASDYAATLRRGETADALDPDRGWTAQSANSYVAPEQVPGQVYVPAQLPDPSVAVRAGFAPVPIPEYLVIEDGEIDNPQGPEPWEAGVPLAEMNVAVNDRVIAEHADSVKAAEEAKKADEKPAPKKAAAPANA